MQVTKAVSKELVQQKKAEAKASVERAIDNSNLGHLKHRNSQRTNRVDYKIFIKSEAERLELKKLKKSAISSGVKVILQF